MALEDFAASLQSDDRVGEDAFTFENDGKTEGVEKETQPAPPADENQNGAKPSQGGANTPDASTEPFHKHPRWIKTQEELAELRKFKAENGPRIETYEQVIARLTPKTDAQTVQVPEWFPKTGDKEADERKYKEYMSYEAGVKAQIKQELLEESTKEAKEKAAEEKKWTDWVTTSLDKLQDEGKKFDRNELQAVALKYLPSDEEGNIDFGKAYEIMTELKKIQPAPQAQKADARKKIGDLATTSKQSADRPERKGETSASLRGKSWDMMVNETN